MLNSRAVENSFAAKCWAASEFNMTPNVPHVACHRQSMGANSWLGNSSQWWPHSAAAAAVSIWIQHWSLWNSSWPVCWTPCSTIVLRRFPSTDSGNVDLAPPQGFCRAMHRWPHIFISKPELALPNLRSFLQANMQIYSCGRDYLSQATFRPDRTLRFGSKNQFSLQNVKRSQGTGNCRFTAVTQGLFSLKLLTHAEFHFSADLVGNKILRFVRAWCSWGLETLLKFMITHFRARVM